MLKKSVTYTDFNDEEHTEYFYFHLKKTELLRMEVETPGGLSAAFERIVAGGENPDGKLIMDTFEGYIKKSYGKKSPDGRRHLKSDEILDEFVTCGAYDALFMSICTDAETAADFIKAIMPAGLIEEVEVLAKQQNLGIEVPEVPKDPRIYTQEEIKAMPPDQFLLLAPQLASGEAVVEDVQ